jgi:hypothetical protein
MNPDSQRQARVALSIDVHAHRVGHRRVQRADHPIQACPCGIRQRPPAMHKAGRRASSTRLRVVGRAGHDPTCQYPARLFMQRCLGVNVRTCRRPGARVRQG